MEITNIHQQFHDSLQRYILSKVGKKEDAEDILQEVFIKISLKKDSISNQEKIQNWIFTIARNAVIDYYRKSSGKQNLGYTDTHSEDIAHENDPDATKGLETCLESFIEKLPEEYRDIIIDSELKNIRQKELALKYNMAYPSLRSRVQRGRERLKKMFVNCCVIELDKRGNVLDARMKKAGDGECGVCE